MKRKFFAAFLSLCMVMSLVPTTVLAAENETGTQTPTENSITTADALKKAIDDAQPGGTVTLDEDIAITAPIVINKQITLNLNGKKISASSAIWNDTETINNWSLISVRENGNLTITGNGTLQAIENDSYAVDVMDGGSCTIENGTFIGNIHSIYVFDGTLVVNGGTFSVQQKYSETQPYQFVLNCYDANYKVGSAQITVYGGSFKGFNPRDCEAEGVGTNFCAPGYVVDVEKGQGTDLDTYTVKKLDEGSMAVIPEQSSEGRVYASLEGTFTSDTNNIQGSETEGEPSGEVKGKDVSISLTTKNSSASAASLNVSTDTAKSLAANANSLSVVSDVGTVTLNQAALGELADVTAPVVISISKENSETATWEVTVTSGTGENNEIFGEALTTKAIEISVPYTAEGASSENTKVYCIDNGMEDMNAKLEGSNLTWTTKHLSTFAAVTLAENAEATWVVTGGTVNSGTLSSALEAVKTSGGTITLLQNATLDNANYTISKPVTIQGNYEVTVTANANDTSTTTPAFQVNAGGALILDGVQMTISGTKAQGEDNGNYNGQGLCLYNATTEGSAGAALTLTNGASLTLTGLESGMVFPATAKEYATVTVEGGSSLSISNIDGNASNGGNWTVKGNSSLSVSNCGSHGLSTELLTVDDSRVTVDNAGYCGIVASEVTLTDSANVSVTNCGEKLPYPSNGTSQWAPDKESYKNAMEIKANGELSVTNSTLSLTNNKDKNGNAINSIYVGNNEVTNKGGQILATLVLAKDSNDYTITYVNNGQVYNTYVVKNSDSSNYTLIAAPADYGYNHFVGWKSSVDGETYGAGEKVEIKQNTTFTAQWSYIPPANPNYKITIGDMENGTVTANPTAAKAGATVTLTPVPDEGYALSTLTVTDRFGDAVRVTENSDGTYTFPMPNGQVTVTATFVQVEEPAPTEPFVDVAEGDWFYDAVVYAYQNELMDGVGGNRFAPNSETTRAQLVTILYRLEGQPAVSGDLPFTDVESGTWYTDAILWAAQNNIVNGVNDTEFAPGDDLTRQQLVTIFYRYAESKGYDVSASADLSGYPDAGQVQDYAQPAMAWAVAENIIQGMEDGTLKPAGNASRAQIATILMRFCEDVAQ